MLLAVVCLVMAAWVTTSGETQLLHGPKDVSTSTQLVPQSRSTVTPTTPPAAVTKERKVEMSTPLFITMYVLLILAALALLTVVWNSVRTRRFRLRTAVTTDVAAEPDDVGFPETLSQSLTQMATTGLSTLATGTPRNAIVKCWLALEETVEQAGLTRDPTQTSAEFTSSILARYSVRTDTISALAALYREARFSEHELTEDHRDRAVAALEQLRSELLSEVGR